MILFIKGLAPSSLPNIIRCFVSGRVFSISADLYAHQKTLIWPLQFHSRWWLIHCWGVDWVEIAAAESPTWPFVMLLVSPLTSLPSAVSTSVYEQVSSLSPSETAILCRQRRCCNDCFLLIGCCSHGGSYCCILWWSVTIAFGSTTGQSGARTSVLLLLPFN